MKLSVEYLRSKPKDGAETESDSQTTSNIISYAIQKAYPDGLDGNGPLRRMYGRLQRKLDTAVDDGENSIEVDQSEVDMISKAMTTAKFPTNWSSLVDQLEEALREVVANPAPSPQDSI